MNWKERVRHYESIGIPADAAKDLVIAENYDFLNSLVVEIRQFKVKAEEHLAQRDTMKALNAELADALRSITNGIADHLKAGTVRCDSCASEVENARAVLSKVAAKP